MMSFSELRALMAHNDGTYVAFEMSQESKDYLDNFVKMSLGIDNRIDPNEYHTTVIYSRAPVPKAEELLKIKPFSCTAYATKYEMFDTKEGKKCLVLRIDCDTAVEHNKQLTALGATSDYDSYKPHVTICYDFTKPEDVTLDDLPLPRAELVFDKITAKPLDLDYIPKSKQ